MTQIGMKSIWTRYAASSVSDSDVMREICAGLADETGFEPDYEVIRQCKLDTASKLRILDFGAGMLRNSVGLLQMSKKWQVTAYDSLPMLSRGLRYFRNRLDMSRLTLETNWATLQTQRFDVVIAILVFQHIESGPLREIVQTLCSMTGRLCVFGRRSLDDFEQGDWTSVWPNILEYWEPIEIFTKRTVHPGENLISRTRTNLLFGDQHDHSGIILKPK